MQTTNTRLDAMFGSHTLSTPQINLLTKESQFSTEIFGYYEPKNQAINILCQPERIDLFETAVRHEATHHYLNQAFGQLPYWLAEGIAAYMEVDSIPTQDASYNINKARLAEFVDMLKFGKVPRLIDLLTHHPHYSSAPSQLYAAYWALVFAMIHHPDSAIQKKRRILLLDLLHFPNHDLETWNNRLKEGLLEEGSTNIEGWELLWRRQIWNLST